MTRMIRAALLAAVLVLALAGTAQAATPTPRPVAHVASGPCGCYDWWAWDASYWGYASWRYDVSWWYHTQNWTLWSSGQAIKQKVKKYASGSRDRRCGKICRAAAACMAAGAASYEYWRGFRKHSRRDSMARAEDACVIAALAVLFNPVGG